LQENAAHVLIKSQFLQENVKILTIFTFCFSFWGISPPDPLLELVLTGDFRPPDTLARLILEDSGIYTPCEPSPL